MQYVLLQFHREYRKKNSHLKHKNHVFLLGLIRSLHLWEIPAFTMKQLNKLRTEPALVIWY